MNKEVVQQLIRPLVRSQALQMQGGDFSLVSVCSFSNPVAQFL